ncbi:2-cysteine adaptor domain-containing protein [Infectious spleen and kidney necrosis virus]|nr:2-cysteine adaptor domain-containing protein [Infectious spleen and kidney necrosis virus]
MPSTTSKCKQLRRNRYTVNPVSNRSIAPRGDTANTLRRICEQPRLCAEYKRSPRYNPWTDRTLGPGSPKHNLISGMCGGYAPDWSRERVRTNRKAQNTNSRLQREWLETVNRPGAHVPRRDDACALYYDDPTVNPFTDGPLRRYSPIDDLLYRNCEPAETKRTQCRAFEENPDVNPNTGRRISPTGPIASSMRRRCMNYDAVPISRSEVGPRGGRSVGVNTPFSANNSNISDTQFSGSRRSIAVNTPSSGGSHSAHSLLGSISSSSGSDNSSTAGPSGVSVGVGPTPGIMIKRSPVRERAEIIQNYTASRSQQ